MVCLENWQEEHPEENENLIMRPHQHRIEGYKMCYKSKDRIGDGLAEKWNK